MLTATEARNASVHGRLRKLSTKRSDVVNPTSNRPPTINQSQGIAGMKILSLDERDSRDTLHRNRRAAQEARVHWRGGSDMLDHIPHPHLHKRRQMMEQHEARKNPANFNNWLAVKITNVVGTMWCAYAFAILALVSL